MFRIVGGSASVFVLLLVLYLVCRGDAFADEDAPYDGVHLCSPSQIEAATVEASIRPTTSASPPGSGSATSGGLFFQNDPAWANQEYDHGNRQELWCGATIAQCGCAMTSIGNVLRMFQVVSTPAGDDLNPGSLNAAFNQGAQLTNSGWLSMGYAYGDVMWTAANSMSRGSFESEEMGVRFAGFGGGGEDVIRRELAAGRPLILEVPGHFIAAVGLDGGEILIHDPYYPERTTLRAYAGRVKSSRMFEASSDLRSMLVTVPAHLRVELKDENGRTVGTLQSGEPDTVQGGAATQIPGATYHFQEAWRDPTCAERPPRPGDGVNTIFVPFPESGRYTIEVFNPEGGATSVGVHLTDVDGEHILIARDDDDDTLVFDFDYDSGLSEGPPVTPTPTPTPTSTPTPTAEPTATETPLPATETAVPPADTTVSPTETPTPTVTSTPTPTPSHTPTPTSTPEPTSVSVNVVAGEGASFMPGQSFTICYMVSRAMNIELVAVSPTGQRFDLASGPASAQGGCLNALIEANDPPGRWTLELTGEGDASASTFFFVVLPTPTPTPTPTPIPGSLTLSLDADFNAQFTISPAAGALGTSFTLSCCQTRESGPIAPGTYQLMFSVDEGLAEIKCSDTTYAEGLAKGGFNLTIAPGASVVCTVTDW